MEFLIAGIVIFQEIVHQLTRPLPEPLQTWLRAKRFFLLQPMWRRLIGDRAV
jgi:hypothetical protein